MAVNLLAGLDASRYDDVALADARRSVESAGLRLVCAARADDRLAAWIDWRFAPSWWSSEARVAEVWYALDDRDRIAGFAAFGAREQPLPWLRAYRARAEVGIFGPYGVAPEHRGGVLGPALLTAALVSLRRHGFAAALIPAVAGERLVAMYERRAGARVVDTFSYDARRRYRTVMLASGGGTNVQSVIDGVAAGRLPLDLTTVIANHARAAVLERARDAGIAAQAIEWDRAGESRAAFDARVHAAVAAAAPDLVLMLGWLHLVPPPFIAAFAHVLNIHPAFLPFDPNADDVTMPDGSRIPAIRGAHGVDDALAANLRWSGATVHTVSNAVDRGAVVVRTPFELAGIGDRDAFIATLRPIEHAAVAAGIRRWVFAREAET